MACYGWKMESFLSAVVNTIPINYKEKKESDLFKKKKKNIQCNIRCSIDSNELIHPINFVYIT